MSLLGSQRNFQSLSVKDLLEARDLYHWHLINKDNVVGTAIGLYLIRKTDPYPDDRAQEPTVLSPRRAATERTFENSEVRGYSWPCVLVLVDNWQPPHAFAAGGDSDPDQIVPRTLYMPDGRMVPVCVVAVRPVEPVRGAIRPLRWPESYLGGGFPIIEQVQGEQRVATVGCLVTDGHTTYALTNRHAVGRAGEPVFSRQRGNLAQVGTAAAPRLTRQPFETVYPEFAGHRTWLNMDIGLVEVAAVNDWTSQVMGLGARMGRLADLNALNLGLQLVEHEVVAYGAASGLLEGRIKALFYRYKSLGGDDYVSDFLIAPQDGRVSTAPGDSGAVWHLRVPRGGDRQHARKDLELRPVAVEWGGQGLAGSGGRRLNFALATGLSNVCRLLDIDLVVEHNTGVAPFWGQVGHYSIAAAAIDAVRDAGLRALLQANRERITFRPNELSPAAIKARLAGGDFVELADVPDLVWKKVAADVPGGRDVARNTGPEHPNHYADIDRPDADGETLRDITLADKANMSVERWLAFYDSAGEHAARDQGLLPFRVWQFFDAMVGFLRDDGDTAARIARFVCAAGIVSHYIGDACQPLHGSMFSDGYRDQADPGAARWPGRGVHATYEDKMVDRHQDALLGMIGPAASAGAGGAIPPIDDGRDAAFATVSLMKFAADTIPPHELCDTYIRTGGGSARPVVDALWDAFGERTGTLMGAGANALAALWDAAWQAGGGPALGGGADAVSEATLAGIYQDPDFVPSLTLDRIGAVLDAAAPAADPPPAREARRGAGGSAGGGGRKPVRRRTPA